jgi:hypothetical protein
MKAGKVCISVCVDWVKNFVTMILNTFILLMLSACLMLRCEKCAVNRKDVGF